MSHFISQKSEWSGHVTSSYPTYNMALTACNTPINTLLKSSSLILWSHSFSFCAAKRSGQILSWTWKTKSSCKEVLNSRKILCWYFSITLSRSVHVDWTERKNWRQNTNKQCCCILMLHESVWGDKDFQITHTHLTDYLQCSHFLQWWM